MSVKPTPFPAAAPRGSAACIGRRANCPVRHHQIRLRSLPLNAEESVIGFATAVQSQSRTDATTFSGVFLDHGRTRCSNDPWYAITCS